MEQSRQAQMNNYKAFGRRPGNRNLTVEKAKDKKGTLKRLIAYFAAEKAMIIGLLAAVIVVVICSVYAPKLQSNAIDIIASGRFKELTPILITMVVVYIIHSICTFLQTKISAVLSQNIVKKMREDLFRHIVNLPVRYLDSNSHGDIMSRMTNDIENISTTVSQSLSSMFSGVLTIIGTVIMMTVLCPQLALLSCVTVILTVIATKFLSKAMKKFFTKRQVLLGNLNGTVEEMVTGYKSVVAYNRQENVIKDFNSVSDELTRVGIIAEILGGSMGPVMNVINNISFVIIAAFGGYFAINHIISIGVISAFIVYAKQFGRPIDELAQIYGQIQTAIAGAERVFAVMDEPLEDKSGDKNMDKLEGVIKFKDVNFSYTKDKQVLYDFNLQVKAGFIPCHIDFIENPKAATLCTTVHRSGSECNPAIVKCIRTYQRSRIHINMEGNIPCRTFKNCCKILCKHIFSRCLLSCQQKISATQKHCKSLFPYLIAIIMKMWYRNTFF